MPIKGALRRRIKEFKAQRKKTNIGKQIYQQEYRKVYAEAKLKQIKEDAEAKALADVKKPSMYERARKEAKGRLARNVKSYLKHGPTLSVKPTFRPPVHAFKIKKKKRR